MYSYTQPGSVAHLLYKMSFVQEDVANEISKLFNAIKQLKNKKSTSLE